MQKMNSVAEIMDALRDDTSIQLFLSLDQTTISSPEQYIRSGDEKDARLNGGSSKEDWV